MTKNDQEIDALTLVRGVALDDRSSDRCCQETQNGARRDSGTDVLCVEGAHHPVGRDSLAAELKRVIPGLIEKWSPIVGVEVMDWGVKRMKTRWGSCNPTAQRIWLNLELAKKRPECLEYVVVHEMVHIVERLHDEGFKDLMDTVMPQWQTYRGELNRAPLAHEDWSY